MTETDAANIARLEEQMREVRAEVNALAQEERRTRTRLHNAEGLLGTLVEDLKERSRDERRRQKLLARRLNLILVCASVAAVISPIVVAAMTGR